MDIVTHGMMGVVIAAPFMQTHPLAATLFILGNAAPDLDAFSRMFGKRSFMRAHQTWSHAWPVILAMGFVLSAILYACEFQEWYAGLLLACGMCLHSATDVSNTFGITIWAPFSLKRYSLEWVFFIDSVVLAITIPLFTYDLICLQQMLAVPLWTSVLYLALLLPYWLCKWYLRQRVARLGPTDAQSYIPSALIPWEFFSSVRAADRIRLLKVHAWTGRIIEEQEQVIYDQDCLDTLKEVPEYQTMCGLSLAYHAIAADKQADGSVQIKCKDLRTRNFKTSFGELDLCVAANGEIISKEFHV